MSNIEWTNRTWNPVTGCDKVSSGCKNCYAEKMAFRLMHMGQQQYKDGFKLNLAPQALNKPYEWKKGSFVFVNSMSDLFHKDIPLEYIQSVFAVMNATPRHTYQVLTKRSERLAELAPLLNWTKNIWMGVSVESELYTNRILDLLKVPASIRFLSVEPMIREVKSLHLDNGGIHWVICGGESGTNSRPIKKEWVEYVQLQCELHQTPFFFKQWGQKKFNPYPLDPTINKNHAFYAKGGCQLNGFVYREMS